MRYRDSKIIAPKIFFTAYRKSGMGKTYRKPTRRRIVIAVASDNYKSWHLRVMYGKAKCVLGCICEFENEIISDQAADIRWALDNFLDEDLFITKERG